MGKINNAILSVASLTLYASIVFKLDNAASNDDVENGLDATVNKVANQSNTEYKKNKVSACNQYFDEPENVQKVLEYMESNPDKKVRVRLEDSKGAAYNCYIPLYKY